MMFLLRVVTAWVKRAINLPAALSIVALSCATFQPAAAYGFSFDYTVGSHSVSIVDAYNNHRSWGEYIELPTRSFTLDGGGLTFQPLDYTWYAPNIINSASAVFGNASYGEIGVKAKIDNPSGLLHADVQTASASVQMGGAFIITGPTDTVDLKVRTTLDGKIGVTLQSGISNMALINFEMTASGQDYNNYFYSSTGWSITSLSGLDEGGDPYVPGLYQTGLPLSNDQLSATGSYEFNNFEVTLTLDGVKTNQLFNIDLFLNTDISGPASSGTLGDEVDFFSTYGMGFTSGSNPEQWFELPEGYSISAAPVPVPAALWLFGTGLLGLLGVRRKFSK